MPESKKVPLRLEGLNGNAFNLMGAFEYAARKAGWKQEEIKTVLDDAMSSDYNHLLRVLMNNTVDPDNDEDEEDE